MLRLHSTTPVRSRSFTPSKKTGKLTDYRAVSPGKVANVSSGTTVTQMDSSYLPKTVTVVGTKDNRISETCSVTWDLTTAITDKGTPYNPKIALPRQSHLPVR